MKNFDKEPVKEEVDEEGNVIFVEMIDGETYILSVEEDTLEEEKRGPGSIY
jgi:hypothetical protein